MSKNITLGAPTHYKATRETSLERIPGLIELDEEIEKLGSLDSDWNEEGAPTIDKRSIKQAHAFLRQLACSATCEDGEWDLPSVYPSVGGGVQLYWNKANEQITLAFIPRERDIDFLMTKLGENVLHGLIPRNDAVAKALRAITVA